jgi:hypothetical protein
MISARYALPLCVVLALALVPTLIHSYGKDVNTDGRSTAKIPTTLAGYDSVPGQRNANWGMRRFQSEDWVERDYKNGRGDKLIVTVVRSFDAKSLYHHPELAVAYHRTSFVDENIVRLPRRPEIPIHVLDPAPGERTASVYALHYDDRFIDDPLIFQLRSVGELLFSRRKPMTLFFVLDEDATEQQDAEQSSSITLLFAAIDAFLKQ